MEKEVQGRGCLTSRVAEKAREIMGRDISITELRLMPYIQYVMVNEQRIVPDRIGQDEREILSLWRKEGYLEGGAGDKMTITEEFWNILCSLILLAYVDLG